MKKIVKIFFGIFVLTVFLLPKTHAQTTQVKSSQISVSNQIQFKGSSDIREIKIEITKENCRFNLGLTGKIKMGGLKIQIFDQNGKKQGSFSSGIPIENIPVKKETDIKDPDYEETVSGNIMQNNAAKGTWIVKIIPKDAYGKLYINYTQISLPEYTQE